ncbi:hypothetical protein DWB84_18705 [Saccharophagus sp. K07]|uniref:hypothetical protein n=1 Tax=Saccharophagus sp. K07 TaxID=2283636 RepID=UPI001651C278|nr:hypothetical protein [Saccharophagus sp. K07]MBC6907471.1 hypothetical protein [Saccharophagus sp. K07]
MKDKILMFFGFILSSIAYLIFVKIVSQNSSPEFWGQFLLDIGLATILSVASFEWIKNYYSRFFIKKIEGKIATCVIAFSLLALLMAGIFGYWNLCVLIISISIYNIFLQWLRCRGKGKRMALFVLFRWGMLIMGTLGILHAGRHELLYPHFLISALVSVLFFLPWGQVHLMVVKPKECWEMIKYGGGISVSTLASTSVVMSDRVLLSAAFGAGAVASYSSTFDLVQKAVLMPFMVYNFIFFPKFVSFGKWEYPRLNIVWVVAILLICSSSLIFLPKIFTAFFPAIYDESLYDVLKLCCFIVLFQAYKAFYLDHYYMIKKRSAMILTLAISLLSIYGILLFFCGIATPIDIYFYMLYSYVIICLVSLIFICLKGGRVQFFTHSLHFYC